MSVLLGGFRRTPEDHDDYLDLFIAGITGQERRILAELPPLKRFTELVRVVTVLRTTPRWPLPAAHPLNPAHRYEGPAS